jgi:hypothetical protein
VFDVGRMCASLFWGSVGSGLFLYGKKQSALLHLVGGVLVVLASCVIRSALYMSLGSVAILALMFVLHRFGY